MATINTDSKLLEALQQSTCFGIAHDEDVPECKQCDVKSQCKAKTLGASIPTPMSKPKTTPKVTESSVKKETTKKSESKKTATTPKKTTPPKTASKPKDKASSPSNGNAPDFKPMSLDELKSLAKERSVEWKDYGNDQITRMRLIMALKKSY